MTCEVGYLPRKLELRPVDYPRPITICIQPSSIIPLTLLAALLLFEIQNVRWAYGAFWDTIKSWRMGYASVPKETPELSVEDPNRDARQDARQKSQWRRPRWFLILLTLLSMWTIYYNHEMLFMYVNDNWTPLLAVQLAFTFTDDLCLLGRWTVRFPRVRICLRALHVGFNIGLEQDSHGAPAVVRRLLFLFDDIFSIVDICLHLMDGDRKNWFSRVRKGCRANYKEWIIGVALASITLIVMCEGTRLT
jgi:hypothetical protein